MVSGRKREEFTYWGFMDLETGCAEWIERPVASARDRWNMVKGFDWYEEFFFCKQYGALDSVTGYLLAWKTGENIWKFSAAWKTGKMPGILWKV